MSDAVIIKTRKFKRNPLLSRKQVCFPFCFICGGDCCYDDMTESDPVLRGAVLSRHNCSSQYSSALGEYGVSYMACEYDARWRRVKIWMFPVFLMTVVPQ